MKISIVTVTYNCENVVEETIKSVIEQTYEDVEYIIVDGNSNDATVDIIKRYDRNITKWISEPDKGIFDAMNKALEYVTGDYVIFVNAGDRFVNNHVLNDVFEGESFDADLVCGDVYIQNELGYLLRKANPIYKYNPSSDELVFKSQGICHQSLFTKVSILKNVKFDLRFPLGADYDTTAKVFYIGNHKLINVGFPIAVFDDRTGGASHNRIIDVLKERSLMFNYPKSFAFWIKAYKLYFKSCIKKVVEFMFPQFVRIKRKKKYIQILPL